MQTKLFTALCSLALVFSIVSCKPDDNKGTGGNGNKLATPVLTIAEQTYTSVTISWEAVENATSYAYLLLGGSKEETTETSITIDNLVAGEYTIRVQALPAEGSKFDKSEFASIDVTIEENPNSLTIEYLEGTWKMVAKKTLSLEITEEEVIAEILDKEYVADLQIQLTTLYGTDEDGQRVEVPGIVVFGFDNVLGLVDESHFLGYMNKDGQTAYTFGTQCSEANADGVYYASIGASINEGGSQAVGKLTEDLYWVTNASLYTLSKNADGTITGTPATSMKLNGGKVVDLVSPMTVGLDSQYIYFMNSDDLSYPVGEVTWTKTGELSSLPTPKSNKFNMVNRSFKSTFEVAM